MDGGGVGGIVRALQRYSSYCNEPCAGGFLFTPVMWMPEILEDRAWIAHYNPFYHLIEIVRAPLLDRPVYLESWMWSIGLLGVGFMFAQYLMRRARNRVPYWL